MNHLKQAIQYIHNTGGNATLANFIEDYAPIGEKLWDELIREGLAEIYHEKIQLTPKGNELLSA